MSFCHVASKKHIGQLNEAITLGSQKWRGARPAFRIKAIGIRAVSVRVVRLAVLREDKIPSRNNIEPAACVRKYFIEASVSCCV
jgi:hypothetical protein